MDQKSKKIYQTIENFLEERKGKDRRKDEPPKQVKADINRRSGADRRANGE